MKKLVIFCGLLILVLGLELIYLQYSEHSNKKIKVIVSPTPVKKETPIHKSLFVGSWDLTQGITYKNYDRLLYFGVDVTEKGINTKDEGYKNIDTFINSSTVSVSKKYLVLKMLDTNINQDVLFDEKIQEKIITATIDLIKEKKFDGLALDLEISGIFKDDITREINTFVQKMYTSVNKYYISFSIILYGDTFYRKRPYDVDMLSRSCDEIIVMAYDFSKPIGEPGPNFPLSKGSHFAYDLKTMIKDYRLFVPKNKLTIIYGMYGYEWIVDEKKRPIARAKALNLKEITKNYVDRCEWQDCVVKRDMNAYENEVNYIESRIIDTYAAMNMHIIWFEDVESARIKTEYLKSQGIYNVGYWVAGYF
jgi:spore germination protein YaaH